MLRHVKRRSTGLPACRATRPPVPTADRRLTVRQSACGHSPLDPLALAPGHMGRGLVGFGGWEMPLEFDARAPWPSTWPAGETWPCSTSATSVLSASTGPTPKPSCSGRSPTTWPRSLLAGRSTPTCSMSDGSVLDDIIVWWVGEQRFDVMPNASNTSRVLAAIGGHDVTAERAVLAVQGPQSRATLARGLPRGRGGWPFPASRRWTWRGAPVVVAGTGYTGEDGVECAVPAGMATEFWEAVVTAGRSPAGLGARDTLRLEAGLPFARPRAGPGYHAPRGRLVVGRGVGQARGFYRPGRTASSNVARACRASAQGYRRAKLASHCGPGTPSLSRGTELGELTSGNFSPVLGCGIGMGFLPPDCAGRRRRWVSRPGGGSCPRISLAFPLSKEAPRTSRLDGGSDGTEGKMTQLRTPHRRRLCPHARRSRAFERRRPLRLRPRRPCAWRVASTSPPGLSEPDGRQEMARLARGEPRRHRPHLFCRRRCVRP